MFKLFKKKRETDETREGRLEARNRGKEKETGCAFLQELSQEYLNKTGREF